MRGSRLKLLELVFLGRRRGDARNAAVLEPEQELAHPSRRLQTSGISLAEDFGALACNGFPRFSIGREPRRHRRKEVIGAHADQWTHALKRDLEPSFAQRIYPGAGMHIVLLSCVPSMSSNAVAMSAGMPGSFVLCFYPLRFRARIYIAVASFPLRRSRSLRSVALHRELLSPG
jgi:hypothetical protein